MVMTRAGDLSPEQLQRELKAAGYGGPWDEASMAAAYNRAGGGGGGGGSSGGGSYAAPGGSSYVNPAGLSYDLGLQRLNRLDIPSFEFERGYRDRQLASTEALGRQGLGLNAANMADQSNLQRASLLASLQSDPFQQQAVLHGFNAEGGLGVGSGLRGDTGMPMYQAPMADPQEGVGGQFAGRMSAPSLMMDIAHQNADPNGGPAALRPDWNVIQKGLLDSYHAGARGPDMWGSVLGRFATPEQSAALQAKAQEYTNHSGQPAPPEVLAQFAQEVGIGRSAPGGYGGGMRQSQGMGEPAMYAAPGGAVAGPTQGGMDVARRPLYAAPGGQYTGAANQARQTLGVTAPTQINARAFFRAPGATQQFAMSGLKAQGYNPEDALGQLKNTLPRVGGARRGMVA